MSRIALALLWLLHFLPLGLQAPIGRLAGFLFYRLGKKRRRIGRRNLELCFPDLPAAQRERLLRQHFAAFGRAVFEHGFLWWSSAARIRRLVRLEGLEHWEAARGRPVICLAPHFVGLDMGGIRLAADHRMVSIYSRQKDPLFDAMFFHGRTRFGTTTLFSRQEGVRGALRELQQGTPFYFLPDMDLGARDAVFVPFFGVPAATVTALSRIAGLAGAAVLPVVTRQLPGGQGYAARFHPAWENFPTGDAAADARRMNAFIEERVREMPEQYHWLHRRFKTRPPGAASLY